MQKAVQNEGEPVAAYELKPVPNLSSRTNCTAHFYSHTPFVNYYFGVASHKGILK